MRWFRRDSVHASSERPPRRWWRLWVMVANVVVIGLVFASQQWPWMTLDKIEIDGPVSWQEHARDMVVMPPDSNLLAVDVRLLEERLSAEFGALAECRAKIVPPGTVRIRLQPFSPMLWTETGGGVMTSGEYVRNFHGGRDVPVWRASNKTAACDEDRLPAVSAWSRVLSGDSRFEDVVSEWRCDASSGWEMVIGDGHTRVVLGWFDLTARAARVSQLLEHADSVLYEPCIIDARFDRRLVVRKNSKSRRWTGYNNGAQTANALAGRQPDRPGGGT